MTRFLSAIFTLVFAFAALAPLRAAEPPHYTFSPAPPGTIVQSKLVYLAGEGTQSQWRGVLSKKLVGRDGKQTFYQWYLSIYQIDFNSATYHLRYQSPANGGPLDKVAKAHGAPMWFPAQSATIVGAAELMEAGVQQLVVASHQTGADCGSADLTVFGFDSKSRKVVPEVTVQNGCDVSAKIVKSANGIASLLLGGPYYNATAAMCCPTKPKANATLKFANGKWVETPAYFKFYVRQFPK